ncbi:transferase hexapeptide repeat containing protein [Leadbetterella byssophila DSM 17132]|uniref:Transferase hexapeptide repeat containing protein n=1 Tax=Leadbetterella byssophila (strain DSM 17132 / JCM 16389 / KACC 11308 / NBRC 106382 / 4M15) TaxID=649349 RepID=E4RXS2_LEAB4|nr:serine acetyltransferase [Leadbetterella byssophila]ADQ18136.1 transferase hexapeptide repeat containing protein [Leadbetterella byssophila DSM 17132]
MIKTRSDLKIYLTKDAQLYPKLSGSWIKRIKNILVTNPINSQYVIYKYLCTLRNSEFHFNNSYFTKKRGISAALHKLAVVLKFYRLRRLSYKTGFQIPPNTCGPGLQIWHYGYIIINPNAIIGENATIYPGVEIGEKKGGVPIIGNNVFIGAGAIVFGNLRIGNNSVIAPNAVVISDVPENAIVGGVPAKILKYNK